jgi:ribosomal protein S18 acetylase RimI-like enzyme
MHRVETITKKEIDSLADCHVKAFPNFFLTSLGVGFLKTYYRSCLSNSDTIALCIKDGSDKVIGFATGTTKSSGYHASVLKSNLFPFLISTLLVVLKCPICLYRLVRNLRKKSSLEDNGEYAELLSIAVMPEYIGKGLGILLLKAFEQENKSRGIRFISLTTDRDQNESVIAFYQRNGYTTSATFKTYPDRYMLRMMKEI